MFAVLISILSFLPQDAHAQQLCAYAVFNQPLPQPFTTGTSIPFTVNFGGSFSSIHAVTSYSFFDSTDPFVGGDFYFIDNFGGQQTLPGSPPVTEMIVNQIDPTVTSKFLGGTFSGSYSSQQGSFTLNKLTFCIQQPAIFDVPPTPPDGSTFNIHKGDTISFKVECSDPNPPDTVVLEPFTSLPVGAIFPVETWPIGVITGNPVSGTFSWTPTSAQTVAVKFSCQEQLTTTFHTIHIIVTENTLSITAPPNITVTANTAGGATGVNLGTPTTSGGTPPITITNNAPATFPLGVTLVTWTATDANGNTSIAIQQVTVNPLLVNIDINPKSFPNTFNPNSIGVIPVAILGSSTFDASTVNPSTVKFGPSMAPAIKPALLFDVNGDGKKDMVLNFKIQNTGMVCGQTSATLTGLTKTGVPIQGSDSIKPLPCR